MDKLKKNIWERFSFEQKFEDLVLPEFILLTRIHNSLQIVRLLIYIIANNTSSNVCVCSKTHTGCERSTLYASV